MRRLALHAAAVIVVLSFVALGFWQLDRALAEAEPDDRADAPAAALEALTRVGDVMPADSVGRLANATGSYDAVQQLTVDRGSAVWVVTPLLTSGRAAIPVVLGASGAGEAAHAPVPVGQVEVQGRLQPSETGGLADGALNTAELIQRLPYDLYDGFLILTEPAPGLERVEAPAASGPRRGFPLQNAAYAVQWWLFAGFAIFLWWRLTRDTGHRADRPTDRVSLVP